MVQFHYAHEIRDQGIQLLLPTLKAENGKDGSALSIRNFLDGIVLINTIMHRVEDALYIICSTYFG